MKKADLERIARLLRAVDVKDDWSGPRIICEDIDGENWFDVRDDVLALPTFRHITEAAP